jgi:hypothetical protein
MKIKENRAKNIAAIQTKIDDYKDFKKMSPEEKVAFKAQKKQLQEEQKQQKL